MKIEASSGAAKKDVRDYCYSLRLRAGGEEDARELALIYRAIVEYGALATSPMAALAKRMLAHGDDHD